MDRPSLKYQLLALVSLIFFAACNGIKDDAERTEKVETKSVDTGWQIPYYKRFEGSVGENKITLQLIENAERYYAGFTYDNDPVWHALFSMNVGKTGNDSLFLDEMIFGTEEDNAANTGYWKLLKTADGKITGKWFSRDSSQVKPVNLSVVYPAGSYSFDVFSSVDSVKLVDSWSNSPTAKSEYLLLRSGGPHAPGSWIDAALIKQLDSTTNSTDNLETVTAKLNKLFFEDYKKEYSSEPIDTTGKEPVYSFFNESSVTQLPRMNSYNYLVLEIMPYLYMGGAHGMSAINIMNFDMDAKRVMNFNDVFIKDTAGLSDIIESNFRKQYNVPAGKSLDNGLLFIKKFYTTPNFGFNEKYVYFIYNPYEIGPYALGSVEIRVPYVEVAKMLQPVFKQRMKL